MQDQTIEDLELATVAENAAEDITGFELGTEGSEAVFSVLRR